MSSACGRRRTTASRSSRCTPPPTTVHPACGRSPAPRRAREAPGTSVRSSMPAPGGAPPSPSSNEARPRCGCASAATTSSTSSRSVSSSTAFSSTSPRSSLTPVHSGSRRPERCGRSGPERASTRPRCAVRSVPTRSVPGPITATGPDSTPPSRCWRTRDAPTPASTPTCAWRRSTERVSTTQEHPTLKSSATPSPSSSPRCAPSRAAGSMSPPRSDSSRSASPQPSSSSPRSPSSAPPAACWHVSPRSPAIRLRRMSCRCTP